MVLAIRTFLFIVSLIFIPQAYGKPLTQQERIERRERFKAQEREREAQLKAKYWKEFADSQNEAASKSMEKVNVVRQNELADQSVERVNNLRQNELAQASSDRVAESRDPRCFYGGVPAHTDTKPGRSNKCERIQTLEDLKKKIGNVKNLEGDCGKGMVMCNPLVFGVDKNENSGTFKVVCVRASNDSTGLCDKKSGKKMKTNLAELLKDPDNQRYLDKFKATLERTCSGKTSSAETAKVQDPAALKKNCKVLQSRVEQIPTNESSSSIASAQSSSASGEGKR